MSYKSIANMASSQSLAGRIAACAAGCGKADPQTWAMQNMWRIVAAPDWDTTWDYAEDTASINVNPDTGIRTDVISDAMILASVQAVISAEATP